MSSRKRFLRHEKRKKKNQKRSFSDAIKDFHNSATKTELDADMFLHSIRSTKV